VPPGLLRERYLLSAILALSTGVRLLFSWRFLGFLSGDDVEILETAFRSAFDLQYQPFEIRNLMLPELLVAPILAGAEAMGVGSTVWLVRLGVLPFVVLGTISVWLVFRLAKLWFEDEGTALLAAGLFSIHPLLLGYGSTSLPRNASTTAILAAAVLLSATGRNGVRGLVAGALLSLAFSMRYSEVIFLVPLLFVAWAFTDETRDWWVRASALLGGFMVATLATVGWADLHSWGEPFASLREFSRYTLVEKRASTAIATQPWNWYLRRIAHWLPLTLIPVLFFTPRRRPTIAGWISVLAPLACLTFVYHKSLRYLQGIVPFVCVLAAAGTVTLWRRGARKTVVMLMLATALLGLRGGVRWQHRKSVPAVMAAQELAKELPVGTAVLSQAWGWGGKLFLGNRVEVRAIVSPVTGPELLRSIEGADWVGLLGDDLIANSHLQKILDEHGFEPQHHFSWSRSQDVILFRR